MDAEDARDVAVYRRYGFVLAGLVVGALAAVAAFLYTVDPEGTHEQGDGGALHAYRDVLNRRGRAHLLASGPWDAALIGSSRVALGYDTDAYGLRGGRTANVGLMDTNLWELVRVAEYALEVAHVPLIVVFVDLHCMSSRRKTNFDFERSDFDRVDDEGPLEHFDENEGELLSLHELERALSTLEARSAGRTRVGRNGVDRRELPEGHRYREDTAEHLLRVYLANPGTYLNFEYGADRIEELERFVARARAARSQVVLVMPPKHALQMECMTQIELWDDFERLKRDLAALASRQATLVLDFAAHHEHALERMPRDDERGVRMQYWFDSSHGTPELGRLVLARVDAALDGRAQGEPLFGVALDASNVEAHLAECRSARDAWRAANREERVWITNVIHDDRLLRLLPPFARR